jgi:hypothetical protein
VARCKHGGDLFEDHRVVDVCCAEHYRQWDAPSAEIRWRFVPFFPLSVGSLRFLHSPFGGDGSRINTDTLPIDLLSLPKTAEQEEVQPLPHTRLIPFLEPSWWLPDHWLE